MQIVLEKEPEWYPLIFKGRLHQYTLSYKRQQILDLIYVCVWATEAIICCTATRNEAINPQILTGSVQSIGLI